jgi:hypothetical protein
VHENGGIHSLDVIPLVDHGAPPTVFDVLLQLDPKGAVVPNGACPPVDLRGLEYVSAAFAQGYELVHHVFFSHGKRWLHTVVFRNLKRPEKVEEVQNHSNWT